MKNTYTSQEYWESYYSRTSVSSEKIRQICSSYDKFWDILVEACSHRPKSIVEIGAYPGRYIAYLASKYQLHPTAIDYNSDKGKIEEAFAAMNVRDYEIIQEDFLKFKPKSKFDIVYSLGFIEHFEDYNEILNKHCKLLAPGGSMLVLIPNKRFFRRIYGIFCDYKDLKVHNLNCMRLSVFKEFALRNRLEIVNLQYFGGFPYAVHQPLSFLQKVVYKSARFVFRKLNPLIENHPNKYLSSTIVAIFHKPLH